MTPITVDIAEAYNPGRLGSLGDASRMLLTQHQFPHEYDDERDHMLRADDDRIDLHNEGHFRRCLDRHTDRGHWGFGSWVREAEPEVLLQFLTEVLEADPDVDWSGYRIRATVSRSSGHTVWSLELFGKHPETDTLVYDTDDVPELIEGSRYRR